MRRRVSTLVRATGLFKGARTIRSQSRGLVNSSFARRLRVESLEDRRMLAVTIDFTGAYVMENWLTTAIAGGSSSKSPAFGATDEPVFGYAVNLPSGTGVSQRTANFQLSSSPVTGSVTFDYVYTGNHRFFEAAAEFDTLVSGAPTTVINQSTSGDFTFSGSATIVARAGESFGFRIGGKNDDSDSHISGTLTITNFRAYDSIVVDSVDDVNDGNFGSGQLTLREAIELANTIPGADAITFADGMSGQTILLGGAQLEITETLTIEAAPLDENVIVDAQQQSRVMNFGGTTGDMTLSGLTMRNGRTTGDGFSESGGGIRFDSSGTLTLSKIILSDNSTIGDNADGGGIFTNSGAVTLINSNVLGNSTTGPNAGGGGIFSSVGNVTLTGSSLSGNTTAGNIASGGGIFTSGGSVILTNSTLSGNSTAGISSRGGGIRSFYGAVTLNQSTLSGNGTGGATSEGGGIYSNRGVVTLNQSTLTGNGTTGTGANGGGIFVANSSYDPLLTIRNSIVTGNLVGVGSTGPDLMPDPNSALSVNYSVIGTGIAPTEGDNNISTNAPLLGPLANNGGLTQTHALLPGSPALDAGDPAVIFDEDEFDQRGAPLVRVVGGRLDVGAFEAVPLVVNDAGGGDDGDIYNGVTTLREAINQANAIGGADVITFDPELSGHVILLGGAELEITDTLTIDASALTDNPIIDAQQQSRVINFSAEFGNLTLAGLTMRNGRTTLNGTGGIGGGIRFMSEDTLAITESTLSGNSTTGDNANGGGIYSDHGAVALASSTLSGNSTIGNGAAGGGIFSGSGAVELINSTLSGNSTAGHQAEGGGIATVFGGVTLNQSTLSGNSTTGDLARGGGIYAEFLGVTLNQSTLSGNSTAGTDADGGGVYTDSGNVTLNQSTLSGNSTTGASANGGGIFTNYGVVTIRNSIVAANTVAAGSTGPDLALHPLNTVTVNYSVIGTGITPATGGNNISTNAPLLGPLANNGGPTKTHALLPGSPALDAGDPNGAASNAVHVYELNNSLADELGGPSLVVGGGFLLATGYQFGPNEGPQVSSAVTPDEYSIELVFSFDALGGYQKIIDFHDLADDTGLYSNGANLEFYDVAIAENVFSAGVPVHLVVTRDAATDVVAVYGNGIQVLSFVDTVDIAVFNGITEVVRFFQDDITTSGAEAASGFVDRIRIYDRDLSADEIRNIALDQRGVGFDRVADGDGLGGARIDIGAYEAQVNPSADFDGDGDVDGRDFLAWQRGHSLVATATRGDGDSDGDADVDGSDLAAWQGQYGATGLNDLVAVATASDEPMSEPTAFDGDSVLDAAMALAMMDSAIEAPAAVIARDTFVNDDVFAAPNESTLVAPSSEEAESLEMTIENDTEREDESVPWLSDELLECVFG